MVALKLHVPVLLTYFDENDIGINTNLHIIVYTNYLTFILHLLLDSLE